MSLLKWIATTAVKVLDPNRERRIVALAQSVESLFSEQRESFDWSRARLSLNISPEDAELVAERVYDACVARVWSDGLVTPKERRALDTVGTLLELSSSKTRAIEKRIGLAAFQAALGKAMRDGELTQEEAGILRQIAENLGCSVRQLMQHCFAAEGAAFSRTIFAEATADGRLTETEWIRLLATAEKLGLTEDDVREAIAPQAERFVERVLSDTKADERLSAREKAELDWLLATLPFTPEFRRYVQEQVCELQLITDIMEGKLPSLRISGVELRAGELVHHFGSAHYYLTRNLSNGPRVDAHSGHVVVTDNRLLFVSPVRSFEVSHRRVISLQALRGGVRVMCRGNGAGDYMFVENASLAARIYAVAIAKANQTIVERQECAPSRHIPRDVRQRAWQRYGGRCCECGATQYLEFDHIIPVAKGGSNSDQNVQLLCRGCNAKKSDHL